MAIDISIYTWNINITWKTGRFSEFMKFIHCQSTERVYVLCKHFISWLSIFTQYSGKNISTYISGTSWIVCKRWRHNHKITFGTIRTVTLVSQLGFIRIPPLRYEYIFTRCAKISRHQIFPLHCLSNTQALVKELKILLWKMLQKWKAILEVMETSFSNLWSLSQFQIQKPL